MFSFEPISTRPSTGSFELSGSLLRRLFLALGDPHTLFGLRFIGEGVEFNDVIKDVGLGDPRRAELQRICDQIGRGVHDIHHLNAMLPPNSGFTINSPHTFGRRRRGDTDPFQEISDLFLAGLNLKAGCYPEHIYTTLYFGTYKWSGLHNDPGEDTVLFVLDGTKHFILIVNGLEQRYTIEEHRYLAWETGHAHTAANTDGVWSVTINFAVGSPGAEGPVKYCFPRTQRAIPFATRQMR